MKKTFLAMLLLGGTMSMFGQTTGSGTGTTTGTSGSTGSSSTNSTTNSTSGSANSSTNNGSTMSGTNTTNSSMNNGTTTNGSANGTTANGNWNGVSASTSWTPESEPAWGWNSYGNWQNMGSIYPVTNGSTSGNASSANSSMNSMNSTGSYNAYSGTAVANLPANVQMRFNQDFPSGVNNQYSWNQYGDWFHTHYINNGRLWQYFYSQRGEGYALVLPVIQTYVPENIINSAVQKYGSSLYSIGMVKTNSGADAYQLGLIRGGQLTSQYLDENGTSVADVWRVEDQNTMNSTQSNAAMDNSGSMSNGSSSGNMNSDMSNQSMDQGKTKTKVKGDKVKIETEYADGSQTKVKIQKDGKTKVKSKPATNSGSTNNNQ